MRWQAHVVKDERQDFSWELHRMQMHVTLVRRVAESPEVLIVFEVEVLHLLDVPLVFQFIV